MFSVFEELLMKRLLEEAEQFRGLTHPNPLVAAAVYSDERIISIGVHKKKGCDHAEVDALKQAGALAKGASLMVTLEPCTHTGSTGPCVTAILDAGISSVVYAINDVFSFVSNNPATPILEERGIRVRRGLLEKEAKQLNEAYFYAHSYKRPLLLLKAAMTLDGCIALKNGDSKYLSGEESLKRVHSIRANVNGIVIGKNTLETDNALCTVRYGGLKPGMSQPPVFVFGRSTEFLSSLALFSTPARKIYVTLIKNSDMQNPGFDAIWPVLESDSCINWSVFFKKCYEESIYSLLLEGGERLYSSALQSHNVSKGCFFITPKLMGANNGIALCKLGPKQSLKDIDNISFSKIEKLGSDVLISADFLDIIDS
jgi:diaminohydroxyphosphoribosylaminopyrimidine deaminase/5-amino-6-(5-phosphoribosylamino)uracil reductase